MENTEEKQDGNVTDVYNHAANLMVRDNLSGPETVNALVSRGFEAENAALVVSNLEEQIQDAKKKKANSDMLYGALWCIGGLVATLAHIGFIFWGAIIFGGIQFFRGLSNSYSS